MKLVCEPEKRQGDRSDDKTSTPPAFPDRYGYLSGKAGGVLVLSSPHLLFLIVMDIYQGQPYPWDFNISDKGLPLPFPSWELPPVESEAVGINK